MVVATRKMQKVQLQKLIETKSKLTGATVETWIDLAIVEIAITKTKSSVVIDKTRKNIVNCIGLTKSKLFEEDITRIITSNGEYYEVKQVFLSLWNNITLEKADVF